MLINVTPFLCVIVAACLQVVPKILSTTLQSVKTIKSSKCLFVWQPQGQDSEADAGKTRSGEEYKVYWSGFSVHCPQSTGNGGQIGRQNAKVHGTLVKTRRPHARNRCEQTETNWHRTYDWHRLKTRDRTSNGTNLYCSLLVLWAVMLVWSHNSQSEIDLCCCEDISIKAKC